MGLMRIERFDCYQQMSERAADIILEELDHKKDLHLCAATGNSPTGTYHALVEKFNKTPSLFNKLELLKLDEWGGIPLNNENSCEHYLKKHLILPLKISKERYEGFNSITENPAFECQRILNIINLKPIDVCVLGLGKNGHIGFNEPSTFLTPNCHVAKLSEESKKHDMMNSLDEKPPYGLTLGIKDILLAKRIVLLISGTGKSTAISMLMLEKIMSQYPVTFLWLHNNVDCLIVE